MPWSAPRLAALLLGLLAPAGPPADLPAPARVSAEALDVFDEPDDRSIASGLLQKGDMVTVREVAPGGWLTIEPPAGSFRWVEEAAVEVDAKGGKGRAVAPRAQVRAGHPEARFPGPPQGSLARGTAVRLVDRPPLTVGRGRASKTWRAIAPTPGEVRHIRAEGVEWAIEAPPEPAPEARAAFLQQESPADLPPAVAAEIAQIEASHRAMLRNPIEQWRLGPIRDRYQALRKHANDPASSQAIQARLDLVARHEEAANAARTIEEIFNRSRERDAKLASDMRRLARVEEPRERPYVAEGMIQPSSRKVEGQKVFALIGPEGTTVAYLNVPAGLDTAPLLARKVGVRGTSHYDGNLRARLIAVHDLEPLEERRR